MTDILLVSGTRPEIIKLAPLFHSLRNSSWARPCWLHTGQHGEMATPILASFDITPDIVLKRSGATLAEFSTGCRTRLDAVMQQRQWSAVIVQGDTESAFLGALAGFYNRVPVAHVEAGLRTGNLDRPFPEEGLRQMISRITRFHFAPTSRAHAALLAEAIPADRIEVTGNTVIDAQQWVITHRGIARRTAGRGHLLVTVHRRENWGEDVAEICHAISDLAHRHPDLEIRFPVHLNPVIQRPVHEILGSLANVQLLQPLDYLAMQQAIADAWVILTDSGGMQEEAPTFGIPVLVLREETERPEAVAAGCAAVIGTRRAKIIDSVEALWHDPEAYNRMSRGGNPFGDGRACTRIVETLQQHHAVKS